MMKPLHSPRLLSSLIAIVLVILATLALATGYALSRQRTATERLNSAITREHESLELAYQLRQSSDDLTRMVRSYAATGDPSFKEHFYTILDIREGRAPRPPRHHSIHWDFVIMGDARPGAETGEKRSLRSLMEQAGFSDEELQALIEAKGRSDRLVELEEIAMNAVEGRFRGEDGRFSVVGEPDRELALEILFGEQYHEAKSSIMRPIDNTLQSVHDRTSTAVAAAQREQARLRSVLVFLLAALLVVLPLFLFVAYGYHQVSSTEMTRSEERFRSTFEQAAVGIAHVSTAGKFLLINDRFCDIVGYTREEMLALTFQDITHPDDLDADLEHLKRLIGG
jgi:methyl-accepting chemotaxis protein